MAVVTVVLVIKNLLASAGDIRDASLISGSGGSPGEGHGNPLQCSCMENPMDRGAWRATVHRIAKSWTRLRDFTFIFLQRLGTGTSLFPLLLSINIREWLLYYRHNLFWQNNITSNHWENHTLWQQIWVWSHYDMLVLWINGCFIHILFP